MSSIVIQYKNKKEIISIKEGETLLAGLRRNGFSLPASCGGRGRCGKCRVLVNGVSRMSCKVIPNEGDEVILPEASGGRILTDSLSIPALPKAQYSKGCVCAIDLGTTTIALRLYDLSNGQETAALSEWNEQRSYGGDVISRIQYTQENPEGLLELNNMVRRQCTRMIQKVLLKTGKTEEDLTGVVLAGNTVMQHIYAGYSLEGLATAPFQPYSFFKEEISDKLQYLPCISGYVGGDITAGIFASGLFEKKGSYLFLDIGTNGEMALGGADGFVSCAVASGPAFEGAGISCGMAGVDGAVSHIRYEDGFLYDVIGAGTPTGLCGSGLIDLIAELCRLGCIDSGGRLLPPEECPEYMHRYIKSDEDGNGIFYLNKKIFLTARDVRNVQLAKAAVAGGIEVLLSQKNLSVEELDGIYLAGGFGTYIRAQNAVAIGMLPEISMEKLHVIGNASLAGASMLALYPHKRKMVLDIVEKTEYIELSGRTDFANAFAGAMGFEGSNE